MRITSSRTTSTGAVSRANWTGSWKRLYGPLAVVLFLAVLPALAATPDDQYLRIYGMIEQADALDAKGQSGEALAKYREAQIALQGLQKEHRDWNTKLVAYRYNYLAQKVAGLSGKPPTPAAAKAPAVKPKARAESKATSPASGPQVKLLEAGTDPRKELRLQPKPGAKQTADMTVKITIDLNIGDLPGQAIKVPAIKLTSEITVQSVSGEGDITYELVMKQASAADDAEANPQVAEAVKSALAAIQGLSGTGTLSSRGLSKGLALKAPANADPQTLQVIDQIKESLANVVAPLPQEAVGLGARWEVKLPLKSQGMTIEQTTTYQLASLEGGRPVVKSTVVQRASNQKIQNPALPGLKLNLSKMAGQGTGSITLDLGQVLPPAGTSDVQADLSLSLDAGGQAQAVTMKTETHFRLETK